MCGFVGINRKTLQIEAALNKISYRGPDARKTSYLQNGNGTNFSLGHVRLAFQDLDERAEQPMKRGNVSLVFNGEIYNFKIIKEELQKLGHSFQTDSDTEVILESYLEWGSDCVARFEGMFAFVIIDEDNQRLVMCRDRFGTKPLYYYCDDKSLIFASEVQCIRTFINLSVCTTSVQQFLKFGYILQPNSIFENVFQVDAGTYLMFDLKTLEFQTCRYWSIEDYYSDLQRKSFFYSDIYSFEKILRDAVQSRLIADVSVGICLSGGYDSSVTALLASSSSDEKLKTFTIGFDDPARDERDIAREFAENLGTEHHELVSDKEDICDILNTIVKHSGEPISDSSIIPTFILFKLIAKYSKAALSADGGDELFAGYDIYVKSLFIRQLNYFLSYPMEFFFKIPTP